MDKSQKRYEKFLKKNEVGYTGFDTDLNFYNLARVQSQDFYQFYLQMILKVAKFMRELGLEDPIKVSVMYEYLLFNGYLSKDKDFVFQEYKGKNLYGLDGASVAGGCGVCLNIVSLHKDILNFLGYKAYSLFCYFSDKMLGVDDYTPNIKMQSRWKREEMGKLVDILHFPNHALTLFQRNGICYISDPTNKRFLNFTDFLRVRYVDGAKDLKIFPKFTKSSDFLLTNEYVDLFKNTYESIGIKPLTNELIKNNSEEVLGLASKNRGLIDDFYDEIREDIGNISKRL